MDDPEIPYDGRSILAGLLLSGASGAIMGFLLGWMIWG